MRMTRFPVLLILAAALAACTSPADFAVVEDYGSATPRTVAILPVEGEDVEQDVRRLFRVFTAEKLRSMNYRVLDLEASDEKYLKLGSARVKKMKPGEVARLLGADAVLYTRITKWREKRFVTYISLKIGAAFELFSKDSIRIWESDYSTKESDAKFDKSSVELAVIKAYEPRVQRVVDAVFSTLPGGVKPVVAEKKYFDWLP
jgi:hypothetical protein